MTYPRIALTRTCALHECIALCEFSIAVNRDEILTFLEFGREEIEKGNNLTPKRIVEGLLPEYPVSVGQRLLRRLEDLHYVERKYPKGDDSLLPDENELFNLTSRANETLESGKVYIPERQAVRISYVEDILHPTRIVGLRINTETLWDTVTRRREQRKGGEAAERDAEKLPDCLKDVMGKNVQILEGDHEYLGSTIIESIEENVILADQSDSSVRFNLTLEHDKPCVVELVTATSRHSLETSPVANLIGNYQSVLEELLKHRNLGWDEQQAAARVSFKDVNDQSRRSFIIDVSVDKPSLQSIGEFDTTKLERVPICPKTLADAKKWAEFLTMEEVTSFVGQQEFEDIATETTQRFPEFKGRLEPLPIETALGVVLQKQKHGDIDPRFWFLQAPRDLQGDEEG